MDSDILILFYFFNKYCPIWVNVSVPEWSKGNDLRSFVRKHARVRTPPGTFYLYMQYYVIIL